MILKRMVLKHYYRRQGLATNREGGNRDLVMGF